VYGRPKLRRRGHRDGAGAGHIGQCHIRRHHGDAGAAGDGGPGDGVALPTAGGVPEETDRVEVLPGAAGTHQHPPTRQVRRHSRGTAVQHRPGQRRDLGRFGQPTGAGVRSGEPADRRFDDQRASFPQRRHVGPGGRVLPHFGVHRGDEDDRAPGGQQRRGEQVVGAPGGRPGHQVGGSGHDQDEVRRPTDPHMRDLVGVVPYLGAHRMSRQRRPGHLADEAQRGRGRHDAHIVPGLGELAQHLDGLVRGDPTGDAEHDARPVLHRWHVHVRVRMPAGAAR
jgi:hypothetical protein